MSEEKLMYAYDSFPVKESTVQHIREIRQGFSRVESLMTMVAEGQVQNPRYIALAKTHLETACMFAIKSLTHTGEPVPCPAENKA